MQGLKMRLTLAFFYTRFSVNIYMLEKQQIKVRNYPSLVFIQVNWAIAYNFIYTSGSLGFGHWSNH